MFVIADCDSNNDDIAGCCSKTNLCGYNQGHCDNDDECIDNFVCRECQRASKFPTGTYCCTVDDSGKNIAADALYVGEGHCTHDWECFGTLICGSSIDCKDSSKNHDIERCCKQGCTCFLDS